MEHRILWVHGIGDHAVGYSDEWRQNLNSHVHLPSDSYIEVLWEPVFDAVPGDTRAGTVRSTAGRGTRRAARTGARRTTRNGATATPASRNDLALTPKETLAAQQIEAELTTLLQARASALGPSGAPPAVRTTRSGDADAVVEWVPPADMTTAATTRGLLTWLFNPDEYLGDFVKYLVSRSIRTAVKECFKEHLRPLTDGALQVSVISHSWGTVVAYDSLLDLSAERPDVSIDNFFTLGSPLWMVRRFLEDNSGLKPADVHRWVNVTARGDPVGSWLRPAFAVDHDLEVPGVPGADAHGSYFVDGNDVVQRDILAHFAEQE